MSNLFLQFMLRRLMEIGGIIGAIVGVGFTIWGIIPEPSQAFIIGLIGRNWEDLTLGELVKSAWPILIAIWGYIWSARSTFKPQVVVDGEQVTEKHIPVTKKDDVFETAREAIQKKPATRQPTILDKLFRRRIG